MKLVCAQVLERDNLKNFNHFIYLFELSINVNLDREKVTEQIITHWFQNKRKITRKCKKLAR